MGNSGHRCSPDTSLFHGWNIDSTHQVGTSLMNQCPLTKNAHCCRSGHLKFELCPASLCEALHATS
jgi:hypothetical protein